MLLSLPVRVLTHMSRHKTNEQQLFVGFSHCLACARQREGQDLMSDGALRDAMHQQRHHQRKHWAIVVANARISRGVHACWQRVSSSATFYCLKQRASEALRMQCAAEAQHTTTIKTHLLLDAAQDEPELLFNAEFVA